MIVKLMGLADLATAVCVVLLHFNFIPWNSFIILIVFLLFKTIAFWGDIASVVDGLCLLYIVLMFMGLRTVLSFVVVIYLAQKAFFSLIA